MWRDRTHVINLFILRVVGWGKLGGATALGVMCAAAYSLSNSKAQCREDLLTLTLYQYATCPYCCKTRAFLDYYQVPYSIVEVNPLFRKEIAFSKYRKVPFVTSQRVQVNDSTLIVSVIHSVLVNPGLSLEQALDYYPLVPYTDSKGKTGHDRANKYFIMFPDGGSGHLSLAQRR